MTENEIAQIIVDAAFKIHKKLGPGLLESVYQAVLTHELRQRGLRVRAKCAVPLIYEGLTIKKAFEADLIVDNLLIVEIKSVENLVPVHFKQLLTYLRLTDKRLGLLINFGERLVRDGIHRIVNGLKD